MKNIKNKNFIISITSFSLAIILFALVSLTGISHSLMYDNMMNDMSMNDQREHFIESKTKIQQKLLAEGKYRCCLEKPCIYCIEKSPGHGEGAECSCLEDIANGVHPCGECIGEILEGHGNKYLSKYFATAIAEKVGMEHLSTLKQIIFEKYGKAVEEQV